MAQPRCPKDNTLHTLIQFYHNQVEHPHADDYNEQYLETINALRYLLELLEYRRLQHKKQQIKKRIVLKMARELGLDNEIDQAVELAMQKHISNSPPDIEEPDEGPPEGEELIEEDTNETT